MGAGLIPIAPSEKEKASPKAGFCKNPRKPGLLLGETQHEVDQFVDIGIGDAR